MLKWYLYDDLDLLLAVIVDREEDQSMESIYS